MMINEPQTIKVAYGDRQHFFYVYRFTTDQELLDALHHDKIDDQDAYKKGVVAYTDIYPKGDECGRMYLLDKSVSTLAIQASIMAFNICQRAGVVDMVPDWENEVSVLTGKITSELYSKSKHF